MLRDVAGKSSSMADSRFGEFLVEKGYIGAEELKQGLAEPRGAGERLGEALVRLGLLPADMLETALAEFLGVSRFDGAGRVVDRAVAQLVPEELARRYILMPIARNGGTIKVAMADPTNVRALEAVRLWTGCEVEPLLAGVAQVEELIRLHLTVEQSVAQLVRDEARGWEETGRWVAGGLDRTAHDAPTVKLVDSLLQQAVAQGASDLHFEPRANELVVRQRIDGKLELARCLPGSAIRSVLSRLKVMAALDVAERRLPQDGRITFAAGGRSVDLRVSSLPTVHGEKLVVRILDPVQAQRSLGQLGLSPSLEEGLKSLLQRPHGLLIVAGPTGSGKTTTLYALIRELNAKELNIVSIEDPVEYELPAVNQVQADPKAGLDFARGLRAILRQDPDVIMIGEIRDAETARIAISAALTGHLVLSTLHTNTAAEALTRLVDMGVEPYLLAAAICGVLSQRLVRVLCSRCKAPRVLSPVEKAVLGFPDEVERVYTAAGCCQCRGTGYQGRIGLHELLLYDLGIKELILARHSALEVQQAAVAAGMVTLLRDGLVKAAAGVTTLEEVFSAVALEMR